MAGCNILIVDDHPVHSGNVTFLLNRIFEQAVFLPANSASAAMALLDNTPSIDWIFLSYSLPDVNGVMLLRDIVSRLVSAPIIMLSDYNDLPLVDLALSSGASGFIDRQANRTVFQCCVDTVRTGGVFVPVDLRKPLRRYQQEQRQRRQHIARSVSSQQYRILQLMAGGHCNHEVADVLAISEREIIAEIEAIVQLLNMENREQCVEQVRHLRL